MLLSSPKPSLRCLLVAGFAVASVISAAGCGSGGASHRADTIPTAAGAQNAPPTTGAGQNEAALVAAAANCLRQHGANVPDPTIGPGGALQYDQTAVAAIPPAVMQRATQACSAQLAAAQAAIPQNPNQVADRVRFARCMRQHGIANFPDPDPVTGQFNVPNRQALASTHGFQVAQQACQSLLPNGNGVG